MQKVANKNILYIMFRIIRRYFSLKNIPIVYFEPKKEIIVVERPKKERVTEGYEEEFKPNPDYSDSTYNDEKNNKIYVNNKWKQ